MFKSGLIAAMSGLLLATGCVFALGNRGDLTRSSDLDQGKGVVDIRENKDLELRQNGGALILRTDGGKRYRLTVGEGGQLVTTPLP